MSLKDKKFVFAPLLAGLGAGVGLKGDMLFQFVAIGGIVGIAIDLVVDWFKNRKQI